MNHLAHIQLSQYIVPIQIGNLTADYLSKSAILELPIEIQTGVLMHRHIDNYTDSHKCVRKAWAILREKHGKYASVVYDIYCDFLLLKYWGRFSDRSFEQQRTQFYSVLPTFFPELPNPLVKVFTKMLEADWLSKYQTYEGLVFIFEHFSKRVSKKELLLNVVDTLAENEEVLSELFLQLYPDLTASCHQWLVDNKQLPGLEDINLRSEG